MRTTKRRLCKDPRSRAILSIAKWMEHGLFPSSTNPDAEPFALEITQGVLRNLSAVEFAFMRFCRETPSPSARAALAVGVWQLCFSKSIPPYAAISETVDAARRINAAPPAFINAVLRNVERASKAIMAELAASPLHLRTSHPQALVERWISAFGASRAEEICLADNSTPSSIAVSLPFTDASKTASLLSCWQSSGVDCRSVPGVPGAIEIPHGVKIASLPGYAEGEFLIQDPATLLPLRLLNPKSGEIIVDCCAAPGGKALQLAALVAPKGRVIALDNVSSRLATLRANITRTHLEAVVETGLCDAASPSLTSAIGSARVDAVIVDVPCSNTGVFRRHPDARWRWSPDETARLAALQLEILKNAASMHPGRIVYSTCSIDPEEDEAVVEKFLSSTHGSGYALAKSGKILPTSDSDGAFAALIVAEAPGSSAAEFHDTSALPPTTNT